MSFKNIFATYNIVSAPENITLKYIEVPDNFTLEGFNIPIKNPIIESPIVEKPIIEDPVIKQPVKRRVIKGPLNFESNFNRAVKENPSISKYRNFLTRVAKIESGYNSLAYNKAGAYGYFQLFENGNVRNVSHYSGTDTKSFLNNPILLIKSAAKLAADNEKLLTSSRVEKGKLKGLNKDDMMAIMWFSGAGGLDAFLKGNYRSDGATNTLQYLRKFRETSKFKKGGRIYKCDFGDKLEKIRAYIFNGLDGTFKEAFGNARNEGLKYFRLNGNLYNTVLAKIKSPLKTQLSQSLYDTAADIWNYLNLKGVSPRNSAALLGNIMQESSLNRNAQQIGGDEAVGLFQMHGDDLKAYNAWRSKNSTGKYPEIDYILYMINSKDHPYTNEYKRVSQLPQTPLNKDYIQRIYGNRIKNNALYLIDDLNKAWNDNTMSLGDVTNLFTDTIERAGKPEYSKRLSYAEDFYNHFYGK